HLERAPEGPEKVDRITGPQPSEPIRPATDDAEVDGHDAGDRIGGVKRERAAQDHPGEVARPGMDELAGTGPTGQRRGVIRLQPLARQDLPTLDQLRRGEPHGHAVGSSSPSSASAAASDASATASPSPVPFVSAPLSSGATAGNASARA